MIEDLKQVKPKHIFVRGSDTSPSPVSHDNAGDDITKNNNEASLNDDLVFSPNDDQEGGHYNSSKFDTKSAEERSYEEYQLRRSARERRPSTRFDPD